jgi:hypothetical protein
MLHLRHPTPHAERVVAAVVVYRRRISVSSSNVATWRAGEIVEDQQNLGSRRGCWRAFIGTCVRDCSALSAFIVLACLFFTFHFGRTTVNRFLIIFQGITSLLSTCSISLPRPRDSPLSTHSTGSHFITLACIKFSHYRAKCWLGADLG